MNTSKNSKKLSTLFITINKETLNDYVNVEKDTIILEKPRIVNNNLLFASIPFHIGSNIILVNQTKDFKQSYGTVPSTMRNRECIILCFKKEFFSLIDSAKSTPHIYTVSVSNKKDNINQQDDYVILLISTTSKMNKQTQLLSDDVLKTLKKTRHPNVSSKNGKKHNNSYV